MISITTWSPDTCGCQIHFWWDTTLPPEQRVHHPIDAFELEDGSVIESKRCEAHAAHDDADVLHEKVHEENRRKNIALHNIAKEFPELTVDDGKGQRHISPDDVEFSFDNDRVLHLKVKGVDASKKNRVQSLVNDKHGNGKIKIT